MMRTIMLMKYIASIAGILFSCSSWASYYDANFPVLGVRADLGVMREQNKLQYALTDGLQAQAKWDTQRIWMGTLSFDYMPYDDIQLNFYGRDKLNAGAVGGHSHIAEWTNSIPSGSAQYKQKVQQSFGLGVRFLLNAWNFKDVFGADSAISLLGGYDYQKFRVKANDGILKDANFTGPNINGTESIYTNKRSSPYLGLLYDYHLGPWLFAVEGDGSKWSAVDTRVVEASTSFDQRGRFRTTAEYRLRLALGYEFFPAWSIDLGYAGVVTPKAKGKLSDVVSNTLTDMGGSLRFQASQQTMSVGLKGSF